MEWVFSRAGKGVLRIRVRGDATSGAFPSVPHFSFSGLDMTSPAAPPQTPWLYEQNQLDVLWEAEQAVPPFRLFLHHQ
ncbi:MAG: hypothetical protein AAF206_08055 [Bacteroidota bacterium]